MMNNHSKLSTILFFFGHTFLSLRMEKALFRMAAAAILDLDFHHISVVTEDNCTKFGRQTDIAIRWSLGEG